MSPSRRFWSRAALDGLRVLPGIRPYMTSNSRQDVRRDGRVECLPQSIRRRGLGRGALHARVETDETSKPLAATRIARLKATYRPDVYSASGDAVGKPGEHLLA